jgi:hypothetical protein
LWILRQKVAHIWSFLRWILGDIFHKKWAQSGHTAADF